MAWWPYLHGGVEALNELCKERRQLHEDKVNWQIKNIKNPPSLKTDLIVAVHEDLALIQMKKYYKRMLKTSDKIQEIEESYTLKENEKGFLNAYFIKRKKEKLLKPLKSELENCIGKFWKNQDRFIEFTECKIPPQVRNTGKKGYVYGHAWFLSQDGEYQEKFRDLTHVELRVERRKNWENYNNLCIVMYEFAPKSDSIDSILIPSEEDN